MRSLILVLCLFAVGVSAQVGPRFAPPIPPLKTFTQTPEGNWRTIIKRADGDLVWEYEPGTKFTPFVHTELTVVNVKEGLVRYTYHITNDASSPQRINHIRIGPQVPQDTGITRGPLDWTGMSNPGWVIFHMPDLARGIQPGATETIEIERMGGLPGVIEMQMLGNVELIGSVPDGLSEQQFDEYRQIADANQVVRVPALAPTTLYGYGLPAATQQALLNAILSEYAVEILKYQYPYRGDLTELAKRNHTDKDFVGILGQLRAISKKPVQDPWHQDMQNALGVIADVLMASLKK